MSGGGPGAHTSPRHAKGVTRTMGACRRLMRGEWPARWEPQEEGVMSLVARFPSVRNQGLSIRRGETMTTEGDAC
jgi:hypothetical protein